MGPKARVEIGRKIAALVWEAERRYPGPSTGRKKAAWVAREAAKHAPKDPGASAEMGRWLGAFLLRVGIEVGVAMLNRVRDEIEEE